MEWDDGMDLEVGRGGRSQDVDSMDMLRRDERKGGGGGGECFGDCVEGGGVRCLESAGDTRDGPPTNVA